MRFIRLLPAAVFLLGQSLSQKTQDPTPLSTANAHPHCRCRPSDSCWPSLDDWQTLNSSLHGRLVAVRPIGHVCHEPTYDEAACRHVEAMSSSGEWRAGEPGALQDYSWESSIPRNETCYIGPGSNRPEPCHQGRMPLYSARVQSTADVQAAVRFAAERDLRLVIKNTGHDSVGRSSALDSFQILTQGLKDVQFTDDFRPYLAGDYSDEDSAGANVEVKSEGPAVTFAAGVMGKELYAAAAARGYTVAAGECGTVGTAGGFIQGAGVSTVLAPLRGLSADLVLQFEVVTADGTAVIANQYQNADLFWALRGGGGGTFGVVTSVTMRVFEDTPAVISDLYFETPTVDATFWSACREIIDKARELATGGNSAQYYFGRLPSGAGYVNMSMFSHFVEDKGPVEESFASLLALLRLRGISDVAFNATVYHRLSSYLAIPQGLYFGGGGYHQESVLLPNEMYNSPDAAAQIIERLSPIELFPGDLWVVNTLGGQVNRNRDIDSALHSGWRDAAALLVGMRPFGQSLREQQHVQERLTKVEWPVLQSFEPRPVAMYLNEANPLVENSREWFWGAKYERLRDVKRKWDPRGLFVVSLGVGSEEWDQDGMCRLI
ncbi:uncharacterized protein Aud_010224 [Aspergillus udagawae]|uniref:FAD-binding PCMH-type domain-containing protein n=1 Tax=Aspergillus udagawae TaxID=91492 RepID=A0A8E0R348_9EURO|nr:uncharacterized protein Aud_010224 [Aspergillus udagawae]GIC93736.1 hypothetical protein Aud_010224 [Aspergillus udagawae]